MAPAMQVANSFKMLPLEMLAFSHVRMCDVISCSMARLSAWTQNFHLDSDGARDGLPIESMYLFKSADTKYSLVLSLLQEI